MPDATKPLRFTFASVNAWIVLRFRYTRHRLTMICARCMGIIPFHAPHAGWNKNSRAIVPVSFGCFIFASLRKELMLPTKKPLQLFVHVCSSLLSRCFFNTVANSNSSTETVFRTKPKCGLSPHASPYSR